MTALTHARTSSPPVARSPQPRRRNGKFDTVDRAEPDITAGSLEWSEQGWSPPPPDPFDAYTDADRATLEHRIEDQQERLVEREADPDEYGAEEDARLARQFGAW